MRTALQAACSNTWIDTTVHAVPGPCLLDMDTCPQDCTHHPHTIHACLVPSTHSMGLITSLYGPGSKTFSPFQSQLHREGLARLEHWRPSAHEPNISWNSAFSMWLLWFSGHVKHRTLWDAQDLINTTGIPHFTEWALWALTFSLLQSHCAYSSANDSSRHSSSCALCWFSAEQSVLLIRNWWEWRPAHTVQWRAVISLPFPHKNTRGIWCVWN